VNTRRFLSLICAFAFSATACPLCHTQTGNNVRAALFGPDFWFNVGVTVLPFPIFLAITALIYFGGSEAKPRAENSSGSGTEDGEVR
jgi:hypothetical protein